MNLPNWDNTFLSSLKVYRWLRGGKWYLRVYSKPMEWYMCEDQVDTWEAWSRHGAPTPFSYVVEIEDHTSTRDLEVG